jgi:hypothetical protein
VTEDPAAMVEAVLNVLAPYVDGPDGYQPQRWPVIRFDYNGQMVLPSDEELVAMATSIVTAIRTATTPPVPAPSWEDQRETLWEPGRDGSQERPVLGGLTGCITPSGRDPGAWVWTIEHRIPHPASGGISRTVRGSGYSEGPGPEGARAMVAKWEDHNTGRTEDDDR